ncbi:hypothetical protein Cgig2_032631 [Carnegiea gigantea]|uniref:Uncharacterized protein n=1 Tax=Carnegiea gigantea TaxID=171969 RepID=A0A9Q1QRI8_9CARY|nr:hypothetical protein Cgig2_032631 [Carnegiea gigantea]
MTNNDIEEIVDGICLNKDTGNWKEKQQSALMYFPSSSCSEIPHWHDILIFCTLSISWCAISIINAPLHLDLKRPYLKKGLGSPMANPTKPESCVFILLLLCIISISYVFPKSYALKIKLIHRDSPESPLYRPNLTESDRIKQRNRISLARVEWLANTTTS